MASAGDHAGKDVIWSPFSLGSVIAVLHEGARGQTAADMARALGLRDGQQSKLMPGIARIMRELADASPEESSALAARIAKLEAALAAKNELLRVKEDDYRTRDQAGRIAGEINTLRQQSNPFVFRSANGLWVDESVRLLASFKSQVAASAPEVRLESVSFRQNAGMIASDINSWAREQTNGMITNIIDGDISQSRLILANAAYFLGKWKVPFEKNDTKQETFHAAGGARPLVATMNKRGMSGARYAAFNPDATPFDTPMMTTTRTVHRFDEDKPKSAAKPERTYPESGGFQLAELPYRGGKVSMVLLVPLAVDGLDAWERRLSEGRLTAWIAQMKERSIHLAMPRFSIESSFDLKGALKAAGLASVLSATSADFSGMTGGRDLYVSDVVQKARIKVDEEGTEAAAVTVARMRPTASMPREVPFVPEVRADRPFLYLIRDNTSGAILFMGRVMSPKA